MAELFVDNIIPEKTLGDFFQAISESLEIPPPTGTPTMLGGTIQGASYKSNEEGARVEIRPEWDPAIGIVAFDASNVETFKIEIDGTDTGDITIGNYAGNQGMLWDQSAGKLNIKGAFTAVEGTIGGFTIGANTLTGGTTNIILDSANKAISINDATFGNSGIQLQYNSGSPRFYVGDGANHYFRFDGSNVIFSGGATIRGSLQTKSYTFANIPTGNTGLLSPSGIGASNWTNPTNAYASDDSYATTTTLNEIQEYNNFGLGSTGSPTIPLASIIDGIEVKIECHGDVADMEISVALSWGGVSLTDYKADTPNDGSDTTLTFGGSSELWGHDWEWGELIDSEFALTLKYSDKGSGETLSVDHVQVKIYYTDPLNPFVAGSVFYVSDGEKAGETSSGSGNLVFYDGNNWIAVDSGNTINAGLGLKIPRLASDPSGSVGQIYYKTGDNRFYGYDGSWEQFAFASDLTGFTSELAGPSDTLQQSEDDETGNVWAAWDAWVEANAQTVAVDGKVKVKWDLRKMDDDEYPVYSKIYVNDVAVGTTYEHNSDEYATFTEATVDVETGDEIEIYVLGDAEHSQSNNIRTKNFRIYYDLSTKAYIDVGAKFNDLDFYASDTLRQSNDTDQGTTSDSYVKIKEIKVTAGTLTNCRIKFTLKENFGSGVVAYGKIYLNGSPIGTERSVSDAETEFSEDFTNDFTVDDLIQIYAYTNNTDQDARIENMRIYYDYGPTKLDGLELADPVQVAIADGDIPTTTFTNQDP